MVKIKRSKPKRSTQAYWRDHWINRHKEPAWYYQSEPAPMRSARHESLSKLPPDDRNAYPLCRPPCLNYRNFKPAIFTTPYRCWMGNCNIDEDNGWANPGDQVVYNSMDAQFSGDGGFYINITGYTTVRIYPADGSAMRLLKFIN